MIELINCNSVIQVKEFSVKKIHVKVSLSLRMKLLLFILFMGQAMCNEEPHCKIFFQPHQTERCNHYHCYRIDIPPYENITCKNIHQMHSSNNFCNLYECTITFIANDVDIVQTNSFVQFHTLTQIFLNESNIRYIQDGAFSGLPNVTRIYLEKMKLKLYLQIPFLI
ncbi:hypothetical protein HHI36_016596 [Cryptolaemus montrouzieri]|uniref:Uncharacterized protein n=1 Tax=Cryptolaemus montrouzieri TaxID=559131 RepID=A0ABD2NK53_9CUCU